MSNFLKEIDIFINGLFKIRLRPDFSLKYRVSFYGGIEMLIGGLQGFNGKLEMTKSPKH